MENLNIRSCRLHRTIPLCKCLRWSHDPWARSKGPPPPPPRFSSYMYQNSPVFLGLSYFQLSRLRKSPTFFAPALPLSHSDGYKPKRNENNSCGFCPLLLCHCLTLPDSKGHKPKHNENNSCDVKQQHNTIDCSLMALFCQSWSTNSWCVSECIDRESCDTPVKGHPKEFHVNRRSRKSSKK